MSHPYVIGWDVETHLMGPGNPAPRLVCLTLAGERVASLCPDPTKHTEDVLVKGDTALVSRKAAKATFQNMLDSGALLVAHNFTFDLGVLLEEFPSLFPAVWQAAQDGRIRDTGIRENLKRIALGTTDFDPLLKRRPLSSLAYLVKHYLGKDISSLKSKKEGDADPWRLRYNELDGVPVNTWPVEAVDYAIGDSVYAKDVAIRQGKTVANLPEGPLREGFTFVDELPQTRAALALMMMAYNGPKLDGSVLRPYEKEVRKVAADAQRVGQEAGFVRANGSCDTKALAKHFVKAWESAGLGEVPLTPKGRVSVKTEHLMKTGDPILAAYASGSKARKLVSSFIPKLYNFDKVPLTPGYRPLVRTGRTSCSSFNVGSLSLGINIQQLPTFGNIRECFVPYPGEVFVFSDYSYLELCTLAQTTLDWFGQSTMADIINGGRDLHSYFATHIANTTHKPHVLGNDLDYETFVRLRAKGTKKEREEATRFRNLAKILNFGLGGGMGAATLQGHLGKSGVQVSLQESKGLISLWKEAFPEMRRFFEHVNFLLQTSPGARIQQKSGRLRGDCIYTSACNTFFQGPAADGAKHTLVRLVEDCFLGDLKEYRVRPWAFIHDEVGFRGPEESLHVWGPEVADRMRRYMQEKVPDVTISVEYAAMHAWHKKAEPVFKDGKLVPWEPT